MDWLRQVPIGQYVDGTSSWLRVIDPRLKIAWTLMFLLTPVLAGSVWRVGLALALFFITCISALPLRIWWRSLLFLLVLSCLVGSLSMLLPIAEPSSSLAVRPPNELSGIDLPTPSWNLLSLGPLNLGQMTFGPLLINRRSAELGIKTSTLIFTVIHSVNLMLITTQPEDLMWALRWFIYPFSFLGIPVDRISFQLLLALRFLPLVQEEFQNLLRALGTRAVNFRKLGLKAFVGLLLSVAERFLANILLRSEQGADALLARGGVLIPPHKFKSNGGFARKYSVLNLFALITLTLAFVLRGKYGT